MLSLDDLCSKVSSYSPQMDLSVLRESYLFSKEAHQSQIRKSGDPYFSHPVEVATILAELELDPICVSVGLLHDVVEDTLTSVEHIRERFGKDIALLVDGVTKIGQIEFSSHKEKQVENFRKLLLAMVEDIRVVLVKLADRVHNMRTLDSMPQNRQKDIARETLEIYAPIAHRLGIGRVRGELQDFAFSYLDPIAFKKLDSQVKSKLGHSKVFIDGVISRIERTFKEQELQTNIQSRIKGLYSIADKMKRQSIELDQVYDFFAFRMIVPSVKDCYNALGIINNMWNPVPDRIKDYIAMPRANMYQSLHTTVLSKSGQAFEIQIRTPEMDQIAEEGIAAHWKYKEGITVKGDEKPFAWLRRILEWQKETTDPHLFLSNLKIDLYPKEVYVFTPNGEVINLTKSSTPIDFAYSIHTEVGHRCVGAKINGRIRPLRSQLKTGDKVEILTSKKGSPKRDWLEFVRTPKARTAIRNWLNTLQRKQAVVLGRKLYDQEIRKYQLDSRKCNQRLGKLIPTLNYGKIEDLYAAIGFGKVRAHSIVKKLEPKATIEPPVPRRNLVQKVIRKYKPLEKSGILVQGEADLMVTLAKCCNPIRGEEIVGYITVGRGISIHSLICSNVENLLLNSDRNIKVQWAKGNTKDRYLVPLKVYTEDRRGMLADISNAISTIDTNIVNATANTVESRFGLFELTVEVVDTIHLDRIINLIKEIKGVQQVDRSQNST